MTAAGFPLNTLSVNASTTANPIVLFFSTLTDISANVNVEDHCNVSLGQARLHRRFIPTAADKWLSELLQLVYHRININPSASKDKDKAVLVWTDSD